MESFKNRVSTFTSDNSGDNNQGVNYLIFNPLFGVSLSSKNILKLRLENSVVAWPLKSMVFEPMISNPWKFCGWGNWLLRDKEGQRPYMCHPPIKSEGKLQWNTIIVALQTGQEWSPPYAKENLPTLCEFRNGQELIIGGRFVEFRHGYNAKDE